MKIGILTYHRAMNYGAVLQAYALKTFLSNLGHKTTIIDYFPDHHTGMYYFTIKTFFRLLAKFRFKKILYIFYFRYSKRYKKFLSFLKEKLDLINKPEYCVPSDILDVHDVYIYGSDQVWRNAHSKTYLGLHLGFEDIYFGNFPRGMKKKIAYAASGIKDIGDKEKKYLQSNLNNFVAVSVREKSVADKLRSISISAEVVLDPIFLLPLNYWQEKFKLVKTPLKHIVLYNIQHSQNAYKLAHFMAHILGSQVIEITGDIILFNFKKGIQDNAGPHDFLQLIYTSEFVVSTSFHGVAFAILFEKQFFSLGMKDNEDRVKDLLTMLGLKERYLGEKDDIYKVYRKPKIDYTLVRKKLNIMRKKSEDFLLKSLSS